MKVVKSKVHEIARSIGVQVVGSYKPSNIGCTADEFFDAMLWGNYMPNQA
jgi:hypothetical protein